MSSLRLAGVALLCTMLLLLLRELRPAFVPPLRLAASVLLIGAALTLYVPILTQLDGLISATDAASYAAPILRALGIALICELTAAFCRDLGENTVAEGVSLFGKLEILLLCLPLMNQVLEIAKELLEY